MCIAVPQVAAKELYEIATNEADKAVFKVAYMDALKTWLQVPVAMPGAGGGGAAEDSVQASSVPQDGTEAGRAPECLKRLSCDSHYSL
jgi:hypothetical protein